MKEIKIEGYRPGTIGRVVELHASYYSRFWEFGAFFEAKVAGEMAEFINRFDPKRDGLWTALLNGRIEGSIVIDGLKGETEGAHLRWFILSSELRGRGMGNRLMGEAISFCKERRYSRVYLWTFEGLAAARHLYEKFGFTLEEEREGAQWGKRVNEQRFVLNSAGKDLSGG